MPPDSFERVAGGRPLGVVQPDLGEQLDEVRTRASGAAKTAADPQHLVDLVADGERGVEVGGRVLEDRGEPGCPGSGSTCHGGARVSSTAPRSPSPLPSTMRAGRPPRRSSGEQPEDRAAGERLAGSRTRRPGRRTRRGGSGRRRRGTASRWSPDGDVRGRETVEGGLWAGLRLRHDGPPRSVGRRSAGRHADRGQVAAAHGAADDATPAARLAARRPRGCSRPGC